ncbi:hypothetical protein HOT99_gp033 [Caulobacter phage CcrBL10]|uniref:Uncharacterized protein n=1 Tax=Caulobacter phage CcrBL10 TaxID=2283269 RepID=A0A385EBQ7_9CAUD|nr:hypothetical protein HOT99_gp033 [Caulobacter phage CcrBL10]AXQ68237.1 hypothetical protein CcrBL10_gp033 [Caulobacter phage CcrBL10]
MSYAEPDLENDVDLLRHVAERLMHLTPAVMGMDGYHIDRLNEIASKLERGET